MILYEMIFLYNTLMKMAYLDIGNYRFYNYFIGILFHTKRLCWEAIFAIKKKWGQEIITTDLEPILCAISTPPLPSASCLSLKNLIQSYVATKLGKNHDNPRNNILCTWIIHMKKICFFSSLKPSSPFRIL